MAVSMLLILRSRADRFRLDNGEIFLNLTIPCWRFLEALEEGMKARGLGRLYRAALQLFSGNPRIASIRTTGTFAFPIVNVPALRTTLGSIELRNHSDMVKRASQRFYFQRRHSILSPGFALV